MLRYYNVFHISQVEGVKPLAKPFEDVKPIEEADKVIADYVRREHIDFEECASDKAYYSPTFDRVVVPMKQQYKNINEYYSTRTLCSVMDQERTLPDAVEEVQDG